MALRPAKSHRTLGFVGARAAATRPAPPRRSAARARDSPPRRPTSPTRGAGMSGPAQYDLLHVGRDADDPDSPVDPAGGPSDPGADRAPGHREGLSRRLPLHRRGADRALARTPGALSGATPDPARLLHRDRLPQLRG